MKKLNLFMMVSLDGYIEGPNHDLSWHNADNEEFQNLVAEHPKESDSILMGRKTYQLMESFWPVKEALEMDPVTARFMNDTPKYVVSHKPFSTSWSPVSIIHENIVEEIKKLKSLPGKNIALLGSNELCTSLLSYDLIDEFRIMINPVSLGSGTPLFKGQSGYLNFDLIDVRKFNSGNVLMTYRKKS